jgi:hypothetical protein
MPTSLYLSFIEDSNIPALAKLRTEIWNNKEILPRKEVVVAGGQDGSSELT